MQFTTKQDTSNSCGKLRMFAEHLGDWRNEIFLKWYNNKDVFPTLEAMQKMTDFYRQKEIDKLKLGCTLPKLANICLHKPTDSKFYPFTESDRLVGEDSWRHGWWSLHCRYTQSCGWRNFYPQINEFVQINCWHRRKPTLSLFDVWTNAYWIVNEMEVWHWISEVHSLTEQNTLFWKNGPFFFSTNSPEMYDWKQYYNW